MKVYTTIPQDLPQTALTIGTFDGVHLGHQALIRRMRELAPHTTLLTFTNHPFQVLKPYHPVPPLLTLFTQKLALLRDCGIDTLIALPFTQEFSATSYTRLLAQFPLTHLILGEGSLFGKNREGTPDNIFRLAKSRHFTPEYLSKTCLDGAPISSSRIRAAIAAGDLSDAARLLGRPYAIPYPLPQTPRLALPPDGSYSVRSAQLEIRHGQIVQITPVPTEPTEIHFVETFHVL